MALDVGDKHDTHCVVSEEYLRSYHAIDANILALFGPLETTTTTTTTTTPAPTTTTKLIDAILADEDRDNDYSDYYDDYVYEQSDEQPLSWEEQQFKNAMEDKRIFDDYNDDRDDDDDDDDDEEEEEDDDDYYDYDDDEYEGNRCYPHLYFFSPIDQLPDLFIGTIATPLE